MTWFAMMSPLVRRGPVRPASRVSPQGGCLPGGRASAWGHAISMQHVRTVDCTPSDLSGGACACLLVPDRFGLYHNGEGPQQKTREFTQRLLSPLNLTGAGPAQPARQVLSGQVGGLAIMSRNERNFFLTSSWAGSG